MAVQAGLGVPENGGRATVRACSVAFAAYEKQLRRDIAWYQAQRFSLLNVDELLERVGRLADELGREASYLEQRSQLRDAARPEPVPLLGVAVDGDRGPELHSFPLLDDTIDALVAAGLVSVEVPES